MIVTPAPPKPAPPSEDVALAAALRRLLATSACPKYVRDAAAPWLDKLITRQEDA